MDIILDFETGLDVTGAIFIGFIETFACMSSTLDFVNGNGVNVLFVLIIVIRGGEPGTEDDVIMFGDKFVDYKKERRKSNYKKIDFN